MPVAEFIDAQLGYHSSGKDPVLSGVNLAVEAGEAVALVGGNGAGKSTLLRALLGMSEVTAGEVRVCGAPPNGRPRGSVGYVPQHSDISPDFPISARGVVALGLVPQQRPFRRCGKRGKIAVAQALAEVDLADRAHTRFHDLSGGQRQRVLLARALVAGPRLLLLDEPFNGLDIPSRQRLIEQLIRLKSSGLAVLLSTHDLELSERACDRTLTVADGEVRP